MKRIKLTENQLNYIFESSYSSAPNFNGGDLKEYPGSEVSTTSNVVNSSDEEEYGEPVETDDLQDTLAIQNYWANAHNGARVIP